MLQAKVAAVRGKQLRYEADRDSLGYWRTVGDFAEWEIHLTEPGQFEVSSAQAILERL